MAEIPSSIDELIMEQPNRSARLSILYQLQDYTDVREPYHYVITYEAFILLVDKYASGFLPLSNAR